MLKQVLLAIKPLAGRPAAAAVSLPNRSFHTKVGLFFGIPINDSEVIIRALCGQNFTHVKPPHLQHARLTTKHYPANLLDVCFWQDKDFLNEPLSPSIHPKPLQM